MFLPLAGCLLTLSIAAPLNAPEAIVILKNKTSLNENVDSIVVLKSVRQMQLFHRQRLLKTYHVSLGPNAVGPKHFRNDGKTPEGLYRVDGKNANSHYHKALGISYPTAADTRYAQAFGKSPGSDIKIHGLPNDYNGKPDDEIRDDWTLGCIALNDDEIDELYAHVPVGIWVNILP